MAAGGHLGFRKYGREMNSMARIYSLDVLKHSLGPNLSFQYINFQYVKMAGDPVTPKLVKMCARGNFEAILDFLNIVTK